MSKYNVIKFQAPFERLKEYDFSPEIRLHKAIIIQAIIDVSSKATDKKSIKITQEAKNWFFSNSKDFCEICQKAELEAYEVINMAKIAININWNIENYFD